MLPDHSIRPGSQDGTCAATVVRSENREALNSAVAPSRSVSANITNSLPPEKQSRPATQNSVKDKNADTTFGRECLEMAKLPLGWVLANGQTMRWATEKAVIRQILASGDFPAFFESMRNGTSADIGCGGGRYLNDFLVARSASVIGIDHNLHHVHLAGRRASRAGLSGKVTIHHASADELPLQDGSVDFVLCTQVLEHLACPAKGVEEITRVLRSSGRGILSIPIPPDPLPNPKHLHRDFLPGRLDDIVIANGLDILRRDYSMYAVSRAVAWLTGTLHIPLPLNPLCYFEQATSRIVPWPLPHIYICAVEKAK